MMQYELRQPVKLHYDLNDLLPDDLGASGIVIPSPLEEFIPHRLQDTFAYLGTMLENEKIAFIATRFSDGSIGKKIFKINKCFLRKLREDEE